MNRAKIVTNKSQCLWHTGLTPEEFMYLLAVFPIEYEIESDKRHYDLYKRDRKRKAWWWRKWKLDSPWAKLFFGLYYLKTNQTYETLWWAFDMARPRSYERIQRILPAIKSSLKKTDVSLQSRKKNWKSY